MSTSPTPWQQLLTHTYSDVTNEYGPHTQTVCSAFVALSSIEWLERVGQPFAPDARVMTVASWQEAMRMFEDLNDEKYGPNGHLITPVSRVRWIMSSPTEFAWWQKARCDVGRYTDYWGYVPKWMESHRLTVRNDRSYEEAVGEYLYEFISWLLAEIIGGDNTRCTYFREQLQWFHAGHFPCGWDGDWPVGRMRIF